MIESVLIVKSTNAVVNEFIPFVFSGSQEQLENMFDGPLPLEGDAVDLVCYEIEKIADGFKIKCRWRVRK